MASRKAEAGRVRAAGGVAALERAAGDAPPALGFGAALGAPGMTLIAEVKRASPSAGDIARAAEPAEQARAYRDGGAAAISVLTEPEHFGGSLEDLRAVRSAVDVPVLRKDFLCDEVHVLEARAEGADAVLLIVAALDDGTLRRLHDLAGALGMAALVEVHEAAEVERALGAGARIVGVNTRNLRTLEVDLATIDAVRPLIPAGVVVVAESGIASRADVQRAEALGCDAVLVGEALMRAEDPARAVAALLGRSSSGPVRRLGR